jgi:hypothetical protein
VPEKPRPIEDLAAEVAKLKGEGARREELFQKQFAAEKTHGKVLEKKFDELFKRAKEKPDLKPPVRDIDLDLAAGLNTPRDVAPGTSRTCGYNMPVYPGALCPLSPPANLAAGRRLTTGRRARGALRYEAEPSSPLRRLPGLR